MTRIDEVWILGATGRIGRAVAARLMARGVTPVLVGRHHERLRKAGADLGQGDDVKIVVADTAARIATAITRERPVMVVNTIGGYAEPAVPIARACMPGGHHVDLAADLAAIPRLLDLHDDAVAAGSTLVTGAGFGVLRTPLPGRSPGQDVRQMARTPIKAAPRPRRHSWGHAVITWPDGTSREGWLRAGDGMDYSAAVTAETAMRLARGGARPGAYTPAAAFGPGLAVAAGGDFVLG
jgi:short subunit dehydrogenase-like uncharacterized protein